MTIIAIKDLSESVDLDRQAMAAITGGARIRGGHSVLGSAIPGSARLINDPIGALTFNARSGGTDTAQVGPGDRASARTPSADPRKD
jgi:hypothetical protein